MNKYLKKILPKRFLSNLGYVNFKPKYFDGSLSLTEDLIEKYSYRGPLAELFAFNKDYLIHKWHHYIPIYDRYFERQRNQRVRFLEIGVAGGGSLQMWRKYFGVEAIIFGIDVNKDCVKFDGLHGQVRIGSQADKKFLDSIVDEMGGIDIVLDDGSHQMKHVAASFNWLFPKLNTNGIYLIEDLHACYWKRYGGGFRSKNNFFNLVRRYVDDMHHWYHYNGITNEQVAKNCSGIHIHDSIVVFEKNTGHEPVASKIV